MEKHSIANMVLLDEVCALLAEGKRVKIRAKGCSMRPLIRADADTLVLAPVTALQKGDVVLARINNGVYVVHRIMAIHGDRITLMGDGNLYRQEECTSKDIYGKAIAVVSDGKERSLTSFRAMLYARIWRWIHLIKSRAKRHMTRRDQ